MRILSRLLAIASTLAWFAGCSAGRSFDRSSTDVPCPLCTWESRVHQRTAHPSRSSITRSWSARTARRCLSTCSHRGNCCTLVIAVKIWIDVPCAGEHRRAA